MLQVKTVYVDGIVEYRVEEGVIGGVVGRGRTEEEARQDYAVQKQYADEFARKVAERREQMGG